MRRPPRPPLLPGGRNFWRGGWRRSASASGIIALAFPIPLRESQSRACALGAAQFFQTGAADLTHAPKGEANRYQTRAEAIRTLYQNEHAAEADYRRAAEICTDATLAGVFLRCAQSCQNGRLALWRIIENAQRI